MTKKWRKIWLVLSFALCFVFSSTAFAENASLNISPDITKLEISAGEIIKNQITVKNNSDEPLKVKIYTFPYIIKNEDYELEFNEAGKNDSNKIVDWVTFKNEVGNYEKELFIELSPNEERAISYHIDFPEDIENEQRCFIFAESSLNEKTSVRVASTLIASQKNKTPNSKVEDLNLNHISEGKISPEFYVINTGEKMSEISSTLSIKTLFDKTLYSEERQNLVFPSMNRKIDFKWKETPVFGFLKVELKLKIDGEEQEFSQIIFLMPVFMKVLIIFLLTIIIFMLIIRIRKNLKQKV